MINLYSYKGAYPYPLPADMAGYDMVDFVLADSKPELASGEVLEWTGSAWLVRGPNEAEQAIKVHGVRQERNQRLTDSDWTQVNDAPVDSVAWGIYRQALRDLTDQSGFPWEVQWPEMPQ